MSWRSYLHGLRYGWRQFHCQHPAMQRTTVTAVGHTWCVGAWYCFDCGYSIPDASITVVTP